MISSSIGLKSVNGLAFSNWYQSICELGIHTRKNLIKIVAAELVLIDWINFTDWFFLFIYEKIAGLHTPIKYGMSLW